MRRLAACLAVTAAFSTPVALAQSDGGQITQNVVADNSQGGTVLIRSGLVAARAHGADAGSPANYAYANAHDCTTPCQAVAAALQVVLIPSGTRTQAPENVALATNVNCDHCGSFAFAYQYVVDVARNVKLSDRANRQITALRREADRDVHAGLDYPTLDARLQDVATRFRATVDNDLAAQHEAGSHKHSNESVKQHPAA